MNVTSTFHIRRYWLKSDTPKDVLDTLNWRMEFSKHTRTRTPYVDISYHGEGDKMLTMMELQYGEWVAEREEITYTLEGDDGL